jgi:hypothetical protein
MAEVTFRSITPVFHFKFAQDGTEFTHFGQFEDITYKVRIKRYERGTPDFEELMKYAGPGSAVEPVYYDQPATYGVIVDVSQALTDELELCSDSLESRQATRTALASLRLLASKGIRYNRTYLRRFPPHPHEGRTISLPTSNQYAISHLGRSSVLQNSKFGELRNTFDALLHRSWSNVTFRRVLDLALEYHRITFCLEAAEHSFLVLMIAFEALFRKKQGYESKASDLIAKLLSTTKSQRNGIYSEFIRDSERAFYKIRNAVAHGDLKCDDQMLKSRYKNLYQYVTEALVRLISMPDGALRPNRNYYDEVSRFINEHYRHLPST